MHVFKNHEQNINQISDTKKATHQKKKERLAREILVSRHKKN